jgi:predicted RNA-binding protein
MPGSGPAPRHRKTGALFSACPRRGRAALAAQDPRRSSLVIRAAAVETAVMGPERQYYLAVVRPENLERLIEAGLNHYALRTTRTKITEGDRIVLYRSRGSPSDGGPGIVGAFEVTQKPLAVSRGPKEGFAALYPTQIPWRKIVLCLSAPLPIAPLVPSLSVFPNKRNYGSALQTTIKRLTRRDYELIEAALRKHARSS